VVQRWIQTPLSKLTVEAQRVPGRELDRHLARPELGKVLVAREMEAIESDLAARVVISARSRLYAAPRRAAPGSPRQEQSALWRHLAIFMLVIVLTARELIGPGLLIGRQRFPFLLRAVRPYHPHFRTELTLRLLVGPTKELLPASKCLSSPCLPTLHRESSPLFHLQLRPAASLLAAAGRGRRPASDAVRPHQS
jgi:hypothetical protein